MWWEFHRLMDLTPEQLVDEDDPIGLLEPVGPHRRGVAGQADLALPVPGPGLRPRARRGLRPGAASRRAPTTTRSRWDGRRGRRRSIPAGAHGRPASAPVDEPHPRAHRPARTGSGRPTTRRRLVDLGTWVADHGIEAPGRHRAARDLLLGLPPRVGQSLDDALRRPGEIRPRGGASSRASPSTDTTLAIQGPPGSGKTYTGARMICSLLGRRQAGRDHRHEPQGHRQPADRGRSKAAAGRRRRRSGRSRRPTRRRSSTIHACPRAKDAIRRPGSPRRRAGQPRGRDVVAVGVAEDGRVRSMSCSSTRPARSRSPTSSRWPVRTDSLVLLGRPAAARPAAPGNAIRRAPTGRRWRTSSATRRRCRPTAGCSSRRPGGCIRTCATSPRRSSTTIASSPSRHLARQRVERRSGHSPTGPGPRLLDGADGRGGQRVARRGRGGRGPRPRDRRGRRRPGSTDGRAPTASAGTTS